MKHTPLIINDPVYGFTRIPRGLLTEIIDHPFFQRLGRIRQLGMSSLVFPGAQHTRQQHSIGAFHLMQDALRILQEKGHFIFDSEAEAAEAAILLHDVGHGPFSHVLERTFVPQLTHEDITLRMMRRMNAELRGELGMALMVYEGRHPKPFLRELICSQLDTDRLDYLSRDSFFTGVREGNIGAARIIRMLNLCDNRLVVDAKGLFSIENYLISRRVMYWQVYLHKTAVSAEEVLRQALRRAKFLAARGERIFASPSLDYFLYGRPQIQPDSEEWLDAYAELEDNDILSALKAWRHAHDRVLATLADCFVNRRLFAVDVCDCPPEAEAVEARCAAVCRKLGLAPDEAGYFVRVQEVSKQMYSLSHEGIGLLQPDGTVRDVGEVSQILRAAAAAPADRKFYLLHYRC